MMTQVRMAVTGRIITTAYRYRRTLVFSVASAVASLLASGDPYGARVRGRRLRSIMHTP